MVAAQYIICDPQGNEYQYQSLTSSEQLATGPVLDLQTLGFTPEFASGIPLKFWKISSGNNHPVDQRFQLSAPFEATAWEQSGVYLKVIKYRKIQDPVSPGTQIFQGPVTNVAGRDVNIQNTEISATLILQAIAQTVKESQSIPDAEKSTIIERLGSLARNQYVAGLSTAAIYDLLKGIFLR